MSMFPRKRTQRYLLRLVFALPFLLIGVLADRSTLPDGATVNQITLANVQAIDWSRSGIGELHNLYPPIGTALYTLTPGGIAGLRVVAALIAGIFLQQLYQVLRQRRLGPASIALMLVALSLNPMFAYTVTENLEGFLTIVFFGLGLIDAARFVTGRNTQAGFQGGLWFAGCALTDPSGLALVLIAGIAAPLLTLARRGESGARWSNVLVLLFPTIAVFASAMFLSTLFVHDPLAILRPAMTFHSERVDIFARLFTTLNGLLLLAPMLSGIALALLVRRPGAIPMSIAIFLVLLVAYIVDLIPARSAGNTFIIFTTFGVAILPAAQTRRSAALISGIAALQIAIAWAAAFNRPVVLDWMHALTTAFGAR